MRGIELRSYIYLAIILLALTAAAVLSTIAWVFQAGNLEKSTLLKTFNSKDDLNRFISARIRAAESDPLIQKLIGPFRATVSTFAEAAAPKALDYSVTNIQVEGVDEADIVKTDGWVICAASSNGLISIVKAYPPEEMRVLSRINVNGSIIGLFISGNKLVALIEGPVKIVPSSEGGKDLAPPLLFSPSVVLVRVFDISVPEKPVIAGEVAIQGGYISSRMIGSYVYVILTHPVWVNNSTVYPRWAANGIWRELQPSDVYYSDSLEAPSLYTLIAAIDSSNVDRTAIKSILTGYASCIYMSKSNLYVTYPTLNRLLGTWGRTEIYRISVDELRIECKSRGEVQGKVLNQFSMDEYNGYFRAATTTINPLSMKTENNVYVLRAEDLELIGRIEGLAPGEQIYSARFMGNRCYLVTFKKVDPLFTIDLSDPSSPKVLGALKIPGYSDYLHPYDKDYLVGIGKEAVPAEEGEFAWYQGLKISLFNVSDVTNPREVAKIIIGDRGTDSPALRDHHALLFDRRRNLLVIPILEARIFEEDYHGERPPWAYGRPVFQGAYIFHVSPEGGITLRGVVSHMTSEGINPLYMVKRALYIEGALYTISDGKIKANDLANLIQISEIHLE